MPLLDHFRPPLSRTHPWRGFHGAWAAALARLLNGGVLPAGYYAVPFLDRAGPIEIDVATLSDSELPTTNGATATRVWTAPVAALDFALDWPAADAAGVEILSDDGDPRLAAAVELVSPANKDRPGSRAAFAGKCAGHLRRGRGLVVVDVVTTRHADLAAELFAELGLESAGPGPLAAASYRAVGGDPGRLLVWPEALAVGRSLPTLPLWIAADRAVPLDLEAGHAAACVDLRVRAA